MKRCSTGFNSAHSGDNYETFVICSDDITTGLAGVLTA